MHTVTPFYAAILAFMLIFLSFRTLLLRRRLGIGTGTGNHENLARAIRAHANFIEYVPLTIILVFFLEALTGSTLRVHVICLVLIVGRLLHAYGISQVNENYKYRVAGMLATLGCLISVSINLFISYIISFTG